MPLAAQPPQFVPLSASYLGLAPYWASSPTAADLTHIRVGPVMERLNKFTAKHNAAIQDVLEQALDEYLSRRNGQLSAAGCCGGCSGRWWQTAGTAPAR